MYKRSASIMEKRVILLLVVFVLSFVFVSAESSFEVNNVLIKVSLHQGESVSKDVSIYSSEGGEFDFELIGLEGVSLERENLVLGKKEKKEVSVIFDSGKLEPGIYVGSIVVKDTKGEQVIPVIFEVESEDVFFDINLNIPLEYGEIEQGKKFVAQLKIFDLVSAGGTSVGFGSSSVDVEYYIYNLEGDVLSSENENLVVNNQASVTKSMTFPEKVGFGQYVFGAVVRSDGSVGTASHFFVISDSSSDFSLGDFDFGSNWVLVILAVFVGVVLFMFFYLIRDRDKLIMALKRYNSQELEKQKEMLFAQQRMVLKNSGVDVRAVKKEVKEKIEKIKRKHKNRVGQLRKLKKSGNVEKMKRKLAEWKSEGYNTGALEYKLKDLSLGQMKSILGKWKKEYKT